MSDRGTKCSSELMSAENDKSIPCSRFSEEKTSKKITIDYYFFIFIVYCKEKQTNIDCLLVRNAKRVGLRFRTENE